MTDPTEPTRNAAKDDDEMMRAILREVGSANGTGANADRVNRTHRVVRERARTVAARRSKIRSLWIPLLIFSSLLVGICVAVWTVLEEYDLVAPGTQVAGYQVLVPLFWSIPVSAAILAVVWFRRMQTAGRRPVE